MSGPLLEIDRLCLELEGKGEEPVVLLRELTLAIGPGEVVGLVGESGAGKSSLLRAILGLTPAGARLRGELRFRGEPVVQGSGLEALRGRHIGLVFQEPSAALNPVLTIGAQIAEVLRAHRGPLSRRAARGRAVELLRRAGLPEAEERARSYPHQLSGGQCQRAMIAMALAGEPELLLADEPTSALDPTIQARILDLLLQCREELGLSILLVTHDLGVAAHACDRIAVLYAGELVEEGPVVDLLGSPSHPYTRALLRSSPRLGEPAPRGGIPTIGGGVPDAGERPAGCAFHPRCPERFAICDQRRPRLYRNEDGRPVRCFLYAADAEAGR
jgi:oligopeptide/dipeptide ABC transporter ATP-binding protein